MKINKKRDEDGKLSIEIDGRINLLHVLLTIFVIGLAIYLGIR